MKYRSFGSLGFEVSALGFGCMRLPIVGDDANAIDRPLAQRLLRTAIDRGVNYIDTAYPYHGGNSETVVGEALRDGYRAKVHLATKLPIWMVTCPEDVDRLLDEQLRRLGDEHIDLYLVHNLARSTWPLVARHQVLERLERAQQAGKIGHLGFSYHDSFDLFKEIVDSYAGWRLAQIQYNYANETVQAGTRGLEYGAAKGLAMVIMEPLLGGCLANPPPAVAAVFQQAAPARSPVEWALQWLWNKPQVGVVLSGMGTVEQVEQNLASAERSGVGHLTAAELAVVEAAYRLYAGSVPIPCTKCRYCMPCPHRVDVPVAFDLYNGVKAFGGMQGFLNRLIYQGHLATNHAGLCVACGACMKKCPQKIDIITWLQHVHEEMMQKPAAGG
jgi:predicted aldo/keto reductase-like oxidoreductase